ncbi:MAG: iron ABC transporter permease [Chloroflexi bacterium]|nr:iron ABC transporter permease [Chloroflexota bacterium]
MGDPAGRSRTAATALTVVLVLAIIGLPLVRLASVAFEDGPGGLAAALGGPLAGRAILNSIWTATLVTMLAVLIGTAAAFVTERSATSGRSILRAGILSPLLVPPFVVAFGWTRAFGPRGLSDQLLGIELPGLFGPIGIVLVVTVAATPLVWLVVAASLASRLEPDLDLAARASGAGRVRTFVTVSLPLLRPGLLAAAVVTFVYAINAFGVPAILGSPAGFPTITTRLYQDLAFSSSPAAFARATALATTLVVLVVVTVGSADALLTGRTTRRTGATGTLTPPGQGSRWPIALLLGGIVLTTVIPLIAVTLTALTSAVGLPPVPENWTLANFGLALGDGRFGGALARSLILAAGAATLVLILGGLVAAGTRGGRVAGTVLALGFAVPGSALAVAVLLAYGGALRDTVLIILIAYVAKFWALGHRQLSGSLDRLPEELIRAARVSGASPATTLRTIVAPILRPSILAAWAIVFIFGLHELTMSSLLYGPETSTLAVHVLNVQQLGDPTVSAALAVILTLLVGAAAVPLLLLGRRSASFAPTM